MIGAVAYGKAFPQAAAQNYFFSGWSDGGASTRTIATSGSPAAYTATYVTNAPPSYDADANGDYDALTDGLLIIRYLFGLRGSALTTGAVAPTTPRPSAGDIAAYI